MKKSDLINQKHEVQVKEEYSIACFLDSSPIKLPDLSPFMVMWTTLSNWVTYRTKYFLENREYTRATNENLEEEKHTYFFPPVDSVSNSIVRRNSLSSMITTYLPLFCEEIGIDVNVIIGDIIDLIDTFSFEQTIPGFNSTQWTILTIALMKVLSIHKNKTLKLKLDVKLVEVLNKYKQDMDEFKTLLDLFVQ